MIDEVSDLATWIEGRGAAWQRRWAHHRPDLPLAAWFPRYRVRPQLPRVARSSAYGFSFLVRPAQPGERLRRWCWRLMRKRCAALLHVGLAGCAQAFASVRPTAHNVGVVVVLTVVLPPAYVADLIPTPLGQREVAAAWT
jgi:hypothetical protein